MSLQTWALSVFKVRCLGLFFQVYLIKGRMLNVGFKPFTPHKEALGFQFPPGCGAPQPGWGLWHVCVPASPTTLVWFSFCCLMCSRHSVSLYVLLSGSCSICSCRLSICQEVQDFPISSPWIRTTWRIFWKVISSNNKSLELYLFKNLFNCH